MSAFVKPSEAADGYAHLHQDPNSWYIRFYLWTYKANPNRINSCKLFWAFIFAVIFAPLRVGVIVAERITRPGRRTISTKLEEREPRPARTEDSGFEKAIDAIAAFMSAAYAKLKTPLKYIGYLCVAAYIAVMGTALVLAFIKEPVTGLVAIGSAVVLLGLIFGLGWYIDSHNNHVFRRFWKLLKGLAKGFHRHTCAKIDLGQPITTDTLSEDDLITTIHINNRSPHGTL